MKPPAPAPEPRPPLANRLSQYFFRGLITFLPLAITVYVLVIFITWTERTAGLPEGHCVWRVGVDPEGRLYARVVKVTLYVSDDFGRAHRAHADAAGS